jgi:Fic family protein
MLGVINNSLESILSYNNRTLKDIDRLEYFVSLGVNRFTRKDYMNIFKDLSSATASRDLKKGVELSLFKTIGDKNRTIYKID